MELQEAQLLERLQCSVSEAQQSLLQIQYLLNLAMAQIHTLQQQLPQPNSLKAQPPQFPWEQGFCWDGTELRTEKSPLQQQELLLKVQQD
jgi:hypothetical protein